MSLAHNVSICVRAGLPKPRLVPDTERIKDTKTLDYTSTPLDANTLLAAALSVSKCCVKLKILCLQVVDQHIHRVSASKLSGVCLRRQAGYHRSALFFYSQR